MHPALIGNISIYHIFDLILTFKIWCDLASCDLASCVRKRVCFFNSPSQFIIFLDDPLLTRERTNTTVQPKQKQSRQQSQVGRRWRTISAKGALKSCHSPRFEARSARRHTRNPCSADEGRVSVFYIMHPLGLRTPCDKAFLYWKLKAST